MGTARARPGCSGQFRQPAGERRSSAGGIPNLPVAGRVGVAEVGGEIHHRELAADRSRRLEEGGHLGGGRLVRGRGERGEARMLPGGALEGPGKLARRHEGLVPEGGGQVGERLRDRESGVARRDGAGQPHPGVPGEPAKQFAGHVAGSAEHDRSDRAPFALLNHPIPPGLSGLTAARSRSRMPRCPDSV